MCNCNLDKEKKITKSRNNIIKCIEKINSQECLNIIEIVANAALKSESKG